MKRQYVGFTRKRLHKIAWLVVLMAAFALPLAANGTDSTIPTSDSSVVGAVTDMVSAGQFQAATTRIDAALKQPGLAHGTRRALEFQRVRMHRIRLDFSLTEKQAKALVRKQIPRLTDAEFARWSRGGMLEHMEIDGQRWYFHRAPSNLFRLSPEARKLRKEQTPLNPSGLPQAGAEGYMRFDAKVIRKAKATGRTSVLPKHVEVTQTLTVDADAVPAGKTIRAWIPYPRSIAGQQEDIRFVSSQPSMHRIAPRSTLQRTVYLTKKAQAGKPTVFSVTYEVTLYAQYHAIDPARVTAEKITPALAPYVAQRAPHVVFTEPLRVFSHQVVGDATNPYDIARRIYAAVDKIPWAGAREYSTIPDISAYALRAGHGDCGEQTLLLITLMRMNGIPARWQSGWTFTDGKDNDIHDWAQIYLAPYGWIPVDVTYGLQPASDKALHWFYLGGLDNYRIAFNDGFARPFVPSKHFFRSDTVDNQRGEVEWSGGNLYYNKWNYHFKWRILAASKTGTAK